MIKGLAIVTAALLFILAFGGFLGGFALLADPTGAMVGFPDDMINRLPVSNYTLPAVFLVVVFGMVPAYLGLHLSRSLFDTIPLEHSALYVSALASVLLGWLAVQIWLLGWGHYLQTVSVIHALLLLGCGMMMFFIDINSEEH